MIRCRLRLVDLAHTPTFTALSYVWGNSAIRETIWLEGKPLQVTRNAWEALRCLRNKFSPLRIWVDAVCIDQTSDVEKARQIPLMRAIYASAERVYIWLGEGNERTNRAMHYLANGALPITPTDIANAQKLPRDSRFDFDEAAPRTSTLWARWKLDLDIAFRKHGFGMEKLSLHAELKELLSAPWIDRVWTLQEVLLARSPILACGEIAVPWSAFLCAVGVLEFYRTSARKDCEMCENQSLHVSLAAELEPWLQLATIWKSWRENDMPARMQSLPEGASSKNFQSDVREHVGNGHFSAKFWHSRLLMYAVYKISCCVNVTLGQCDRACRTFAARFPVTTSLAVMCIPGILGFVVIYKTFAFRWTVQSALYQMLLIQLVTIPLMIIYTKVLSLPYRERSVPWKLALTAQIAIRKCTIQHDAYYGVLGIIGFNLKSASSVEETALPPSKDAYRSLCLDLAAWPDSLDFLLFCSPQKTAGAPSWVVQWHQADPLWWTYLYRNDPSWSDMSPPRLGVVGATPGSAPCYVWDCCYGNQLRVRALFITTIDWMIPPDLQSSARDRMANVEQQTFHEVLTATGTSASSWRGYWQYFNLGNYKELVSRAVTDNRAVFRWRRPQSGSVFGLAPRDLAVGDHLVLVPGLSLPIILRAEQRHCYQVIGPAFISGLMSGEAWTPETQQRLEEIVLI